jgi:hypothetical protein
VIQLPFVRIKNCLNCHIAHEWLFTQPTLKELRLIKQLTGMSTSQFSEAGDAGDPDALTALVVVLHKRDRINLAFDDADLDFSDFEMEETGEEKAERVELESRMKRAADMGQQAPKEKTRNGRPVKAAS